MPHHRVLLDHRAVDDRVEAHERRALVGHLPSLRIRRAPPLLADARWSDHGRAMGQSYLVADNDRASSGVEEDAVLDVAPVTDPDRALLAVFRPGCGERRDLDELAVLHVLEAGRGRIDERRACVPSG
jgi:hypothetical protein